MLLRFTVDNFMSFKDRAELSMLPSRVTRLPHHVIKGEKWDDFSALKGAVIYGANASGKSNLIRAIAHARQMITESTKAGSKLPYFPFRLDKKSRSSPTRVEFEIKTETGCFAYGFVADGEKILEEWLIRITKSKEQMVFERKNSAQSDLSSVSFGSIQFVDKDEEQFLQFTARGTPDNRLFLNECKERGVWREVVGSADLRTVFEWFDERLSIVFPDTKYSGLEMAVSKGDSMKDQFATFLQSFDTGIDDLTLGEVQFPEGLAEIPRKVKDNIIEHLRDNPDSRVMVAGPKNVRFLITGENGDYKAFKLMTVHLDSDGQAEHFDISQESDGTQRIVDLLPGLLEVLTEEKVYIVDEFDRSLHSELTTSFLNSFFEMTKGVASQLIVTSHETNLLDQEKIRKDEIWFVQKKPDGGSELYSLEEFKPRFDKNIRRGYLAGRFGGVPSIKQRDLLVDLENS